MRDNKEEKHVLVHFKREPDIFVDDGVRCAIIPIKLPTADDHDEKPVISVRVDDQVTIPDPRRSQSPNGLPPRIVNNSP